MLTPYMPEENLLYYGDNLDILHRYIKDESVDLVYLDPPFNSNQDYNVLFQEQDGTRAASQIKAFNDTWRWDQGSARAFHDVVTNDGRVADVMVAFEKFVGHSDMLAYLSMMAPRLIALRRVLRRSGSIYLHCDPTASHYLKMLMDAVFGPEHFRSEITWKRTYAHGGAKRYGPVHDTILYYTKSDEYTWNDVPTDYSEDYLDNFFKFQDPDGKRYRKTILTGPGTRHGSSGKPWREVDPTKSGRHWAVPGFVRPLLGDVDPSDTQAALDKLDSIGRVLWPKKPGGVPSFKQYQTDIGGVYLQDVWTDIPPISSQAAERLGYPTQKPERLMERIIQASSKEGDIVLDPFCGCGTTIAAAQKLRRPWIGIDITQLAISLIKHRLMTAYGDAAKYEVVGEPVTLQDAEVLAREDPYQFQWWALGLVGARSVEQKKGKDQGIDGRLYFFPDQTMTGRAEQIIFSVKAGGVAVSHVRDLRGVVDREKAAIGVLISMNQPTADMKKEAATAEFYVSNELGEKKYPRIQLLTVEDLLSGHGVQCPPFAKTQGNVTFKKAPETKVKKKPRTKASTIHEYDS